MTQGRATSSATNDYALLAKLASGGMADLYLARTTSSTGVQRYVVLKRVLSQRADDVTFVNMFLDEAWLAAQLHHPNIAQVFDTGKLGDSYFFTMEYVHGETVRDLLYRAYDAQFPIPLGCALAIIAGAAAGLAHAHDRTGPDGEPLGIVHRDVSPSNIMISYEGHVKLVDFGVAKATRRSVETQAGTIKGKVGYMAPEQCRGGDVDARADLFSLGIVMWELLVGDRLFKRATDFETMEAIDREPAPAPSTRRATLPPAIDAIVLRLLEKKPGARFQSAHELLDAIEEAALAIKEPVTPSALRRFVTELFGHKPEPWLKLETLGGKDRPESVTVTGAPPLAAIGADGSARDVRLDRLLDLSTPPQGSIPIARDVDAELPRSRRAVRWPLALAALALAVASVIVVAIVIGRQGDARATTDARDAANAVDAATARTAIVPDARPTPPPPPIDAPAQTPAEVLAAATRAGRYADALAACTADATLPTANAVACTLAACREKAVESARAWAKGLARGERAKTTEACRAFGVALVPPSPSRPPPRVDPPPRRCDDPMECRK